MDATTLESGAILTVAAGFFAALGGFAVTVWGRPEERMRHEQQLETIESTAQVQIAEVGARASSAAVTALAQRCEAMEQQLATVQQLLSQQVQRTDLLGSTNTKLTERIERLRGRVSHLEQQLQEAGLVHTADLATISNLRAELDAHVAELTETRRALSERDSRIAALEARVAELEEALRAARPAAKTKGKRK